MPVSRSALMLKRERRGREREREREKREEGNAFGIVEKYSAKIRIYLFKVESFVRMIRYIHIHSYIQIYTLLSKSLFSIVNEKETKISTFSYFFSFLFFSLFFFWFFSFATFKAAEEPSVL